MHEVGRLKENRDLKAAKRGKQTLATLKGIALSPNRCMLATVEGRVFCWYWGSAFFFGPRKVTGQGGKVYELKSRRTAVDAAHRLPSRRRDCTTVENLRGKQKRANVMKGFSVEAAGF